MLNEAAKILATGSWTSPLIGARAGIGQIFGSFLIAISRNPLLLKTLFTYAILGFALVEAIALFGLMMAFLLLFVLKTMLWGPQPWLENRPEEAHGSVTPTEVGSMVCPVYTCFAYRSTMSEIDNNEILVSNGSSISYGKVLTCKDGITKVGPHNAVVHEDLKFGSQLNKVSFAALMPWGHNLLTGACLPDLVEWIVSNRPEDGVVGGILVWAPAVCGLLWLRWYLKGSWEVFTYGYHAGRAGVQLDWRHLIHFNRRRRRRNVTLFAGGLVIGALAAVLVFGSGSSGKPPRKSLLNQFGEAVGRGIASSSTVRDASAQAIKEGVSEGVQTLGKEAAKGAIKGAKDVAKDACTIM